MFKNFHIWSSTSFSAHPPHFTLYFNPHIFFGLPLPLFLSKYIHFETLHSSSLLEIWSSYLNLLFFILSTIEANPILHIIYSLFILSSLGNSLIHINAILSATLILYPIILSTAQHSDLYIDSSLVFTCKIDRLT